MSKGKKYDDLKPDLSLIPTDALWGMAEALTYGAKKYSKHNFREGINYSRLVAACMRHLTVWNEGKEFDDESKLNHIDHAMASLAMLKYMMVNKKEFDDRFICDKNLPIIKSTSESLLNSDELLDIGLNIQMRGR